jgi:hypothetical protein
MYDEFIRPTRERRKIMYRKMILLTTFTILSLIASSCTLVQAPAASGATSQPNDVPIETQVALIVAQTQAAQTVIANAVQATLVGAATDTPKPPDAPAATPTLESTFTPSFTNTPNAPQVTVSVNTNCRSGPNTNYDLLGVMMVGEKAEAVGRSTLTDTIIIKLPSNPAITCWLWMQNATLTGDRESLPLIPIPATPTPKFTNTPANTFTLVYAGTQFCVGLYRHKFQIKNNGVVSLESNKLIVTDQTTAITKTSIRDNFPYYDASCGSIADNNLEAGEVGYTTSEGFAIDPTGHSMVATIRVCSQDGLAGTCQEKTITFTP